MDRKQGKAVIVMELVEGGSLFKFLRERADHPNTFTWSQRWKLTMQAVHAVEYIHLKGIIHRDIKSPNFLVSVSFTSHYPNHDSDELSLMEEEKSVD